MMSYRMSRMGFSRKKPSLWLSRKTRSRLEGVKTLSSIVARKNPLVDSLATSKEIFDSTYRIINGKEPPRLLPSLWNSHNRTRIVPQRLHRISMVRRPHPFDCQCPFHGGHASRMNPRLRGIGRRLKLGPQR